MAYFSSPKMLEKNYPLQFSREINLCRTSRRISPCRKKCKLNYLKLHLKTEFSVLKYEYRYSRQVKSFRIFKFLKRVQAFCSSLYLRNLSKNISSLKIDHCLIIERKTFLKNIVLKHVNSDLSNLHKAKASH